MNVCIVSHTALQIEFILLSIVAPSMFGRCVFGNIIYIRLLRALFKHAMMDSICFKLEIDLNEEVTCSINTMLEILLTMKGVCKLVEFVVSVDNDIKMS